MSISCHIRLRYENEINRELRLTEDTEKTCAEISDISEILECWTWEGESITLITKQHHYIKQNERIRLR